MVLKLISEDKTYGYELIAKIDKKSQGLFKMKEGTLYPILYKLEDEGLIQSEWQNPEGKQKAKMFDLTILGVLLLALAVYHGIPLAAPWLAAKYVLSGINKCSGKYTDFHGISIGGKGNPNKAGNRINGRSSHAAVGNPKKEKETVDVMPAGFSPSLFLLPTHQLICLNSGCRASKGPRLFQRGHRIRRL